MASNRGAKDNSVPSWFAAAFLSTFQWQAIGIDEQATIFFGIGREGPLFEERQNLTGRATQAHLTFAGDKWAVDQDGMGNHCFQELFPRDLWRRQGHLFGGGFGHSKCLMGGDASSGKEGFQLWVIGI